MHASCLHAWKIPMHMQCGPHKDLSSVEVTLSKIEDLIICRKIVE